MIICDYLILWLFDDYLHYLHYLHYSIINIEKHFIHTKMGKANDSPFRFCQAMLPQNTCGQVCTTGKGYLWFAWLLTARRPLCFWMSAVNIVRMQGWELAITVYAFEIQESLCLLALRLTYLAAHPPPQQVQCITLRLPLAMFTVVDWTARYSSKTRKRSAASVADFEEC